jgi:N-acetylated-alpha-linked acidic dipeptidase
VFFSQILRDINDPKKRQPLLTAARARRAQGDRSDSKEEGFRLGPLGAGSDYVAFLHHTGIASINAGFSSGDPAGVYHSIYDSFDWYTKFSDKDFSYGAALARVMATTLMRMADATVLPFEFTSVVSALESYAGELTKNKDVGSKVNLSTLVPHVEKLRAAATAFEKALSKAAVGDEKTRARVNRALIETERAWLVDAGLPGRPWYKHQLVAPGVYTGYSAKTIPGIREAVEAGRWDEANAQVKVLAGAIRAVTAKIRAAVAAAGGLSR